MQLYLNYFSLSQYSDENMMDAYNLAVCFGPSVIDIPPRSDPVMCQANINSVIKVNNNTYISSALKCIYCITLL